MVFITNLLKNISTIYLYLKLKIDNQYYFFNKKKELFPKMTRTELASILKVDIKTLKNWEKDKKELVRLINLGLQTDRTIEETRNLLKQLEEMEEKSNSGKFKLK